MTRAQRRAARSGRGSVVYATWTQRAVGYLIDSFLISAPLILAQLVGTDDEAAAIAFVCNLASLALTVYNRWILSGRTGQSWGRQRAGTRLVDAKTRRPIGAWRAFLRDLAHLVDALTLYIGFLLPLWDRRRQTLADKIMGTVVIR